MDVLCGGMYRACSTWQYQVASHLLERHRGAARLGYLTGDEFAAREGTKEDRDGPSWRVLKSHEEHPRFRGLIESGEALVIYGHRDLRDVIYSLMHKRRMSFETILRQGMIHQVIANDRFWSRGPGVLVQRYTDLIAEPVRGVEEIAAHLGLTLAEGEADEIAALYSFQANRARTTELSERLRAGGLALDDPSNAQAWDKNNLLHWNHLRDGRVGTWRELATPSQRYVLSLLCDRWLKAHGYDLGETDHRPLGLQERLAARRDSRRGWLACALRCASLRHPRASRWVKHRLGLSTEAHPQAATMAIPPPHFSLESSAGSWQASPPEEFARPS